MKKGVLNRCLSLVLSGALTCSLIPAGLLSLSASAAGESFGTGKGSALAESGNSGGKLKDSIKIQEICDDFGEADFQIEPPVIYTQPKDITVLPGGYVELSVEASNPEGSVISYQWYKSAIISEHADEKIAGAVNKTFRPNTSVVGLSRYYVVVKAQFPDGSVTETKSRVAYVVAAINPPCIISHPRDQVTTVGEKIVMSVRVEPQSTAVMSYQWYEAENRTSQGKLILGERENNFYPSTLELGRKYYYAVVTVTHGTATQVSRSETAQIEVKEGPVSLSDVFFEDIKEGDPQPDAQALEIRNNGQSDLVIDRIYPVKPYSIFAVTQGDGEIPAKGSNNSWTIQPKGEIAAGEYRESIVFEYTEQYIKRTIYFEVSLTVGGKELIDAQKPVVSLQTEYADIQLGESVTLTADAEVSDSGELSYQWYSAGEESGEGMEIPGAEGESFTVDAAPETGNFYYYVKVTNTNPGATGSKTAEAKSGYAKVTVREKTPEAAIDYTAETLTGLEDASYSIGGINTTVTNGSTQVDESWMKDGGISIVKKSESGDFDSSPQILNIPKRPAKPSPSVSGETAPGKKDGKITGVNQKMEYSRDKINWIPCEGTEIKNLAPGEYRIRFKAVQGESFKSGYAAVTVKKAEVTVPVKEFPFGDVKEKDWFYPALEYVWEKDLMAGTSEEAFSPMIPVSRGMMVTVMWKMEGHPESARKDGFTDLKNDWYVTAANWAKENNVVEGYGGNVFKPDQNITREELAVMLYKYSLWKGMDVTKKADLDIFTDGSKTSGWALDAIQWAVAEEILSGYGEGIFAPRAVANRAQLASILKNFNS